MTDLRAYLQTIANIAEYGARSPDPAEAHAADTILARDLPRDMKAGGHRRTGRSLR
jgi:hypothetical protein